MSKSLGKLLSLQGDRNTPYASMDSHQFHKFCRGTATCSAVILGAQSKQPFDSEEELKMARNLLSFSRLG
jgi:hypothetical protein